MGFSSSEIDYSETVSEKNYLEYSKNIGIWPKVINDTFREYFIMNPPNQNICKIGSSSKLISGVWRKLNESSFFCVKKIIHIKENG